MKKNWTGERLETFVLNETTVEHLHRYGIVMPYVENKIVLDIASGEGYGSKLISTRAQKVTGVDIDPATVQNAIDKYQAPNLTFLQGSADKIPVADSSVDVVVSFETIEHHDKHEEMMKEIKRVLKPGGVMIMSSPEKTGDVSFNEFHVKELSRSEFIDLVRAHFKFSKFYSQKIVFGSMIAPIEPEAGKFDYQEGDYHNITSHNEIPRHVFNLCVATDSEAADMPVSFFDGRDILLEHIVTPYKNSRLLKLGAFLKKILPV